MLRHSLILLLSLGLVATMPLPLSACATLRQLPRECATPGSQLECEPARMTSASPQVEMEPNLACCQVSSAPANQTQTAAVAPQVVSEAAAPSPAVAVVAAPGQPVAARPAPLASPPDLQPLLCTFLI